MVESYNYFGAQNIDFPPSFKISFIIIVLLCPRTAQYIRCNFTNTMDRQDQVGSIHWTFNYVSGDEDGPEYIGCVDVRDPDSLSLDFW